MVDYEKMYAVMLSAASSAVDLLPVTPENMPALAVLRRAMLEAEELYISAEDD